MQARDVMTTQVVTVKPDTMVSEIAKRLIERRISGVPVVDDEGRVRGIVSEGDLMRRRESGTERRSSWWLALMASPEEQARDFTMSHGLHAEDVMSRKVVTVTEDTALEEIATILEKHAIKRVPVVRDGKLVGIVSRANLLHGLVARATGGTVSVDDRTIKAALEEAVKEAGIRAVFVNIVVSGAVVHLWGAVESEAEKRALHAAAESTAGVKEVDDKVGIMPDQVRQLLWAE